ncbi:MAG: putative phosphoesterase [Glaciihabitans sp.]|nr:putative phosphoesterase [Glaciihabitans sp.]
MTTRLVIIADTHVPARAKRLPPTLWPVLEQADIVVHAGDWVEPALLDELQERCRRVIGVYGNNDGEELRTRLPLVALNTIEGMHVAVVHETGPAPGREARADIAFPTTDVLIFGHSHIPWNTTSPRGMRLLNPGSPTDRRRQPHCTYLTAEITDGELTNVTTVNLPR